jgi:ferredoxin-NADP reductase
VQSPTPTVKLLHLRTLSPPEPSFLRCSQELYDLRFSQQPGPLAFEGGQWIDLAIPGITAVGGYSLVSRSGQATFEIAVKRARHPPAQWVHTGAQPGALAAVRVGGSFSLSRLPLASSTRLLLLAGGVGINPLYCMLLELARTPRPYPQLARIDLLYAARQPEELLFLSQLQELAAGGPLAGVLHLHTLVTSSPGHSRAMTAAAAQRLASSSSSSSAGGLSVVMCGPPSFSEDMASAMGAAGVPASSVHCEKWW